MPLYLTFNFFFSRDNVRLVFTPVFGGCGLYLVGVLNDCRFRDSALYRELVFRPLLEVVQYFCWNWKVHQVFPI